MKFVLPVVGGVPEIGKLDYRYRVNITCFCPRRFVFLGDDHGRKVG
jgi:hypothetical protein